MKSKLEKYVTQIVQQTDCSKEEKEDLYEELLVHLQLSKDEIMLEEGLTQAEAEEKAMQQFGSESVIGNQIQQSLFPFRKELQLTLGISSILFAISAYMFHLLVEGNAQITWLILFIGFSSLLVFIPLQQNYTFNCKRWLNSLLVIHLLTAIYGYLMVNSIDHTASLGLTIWVWLNIILSIFLIYQATTHDINSSYKPIKLIHIMNITSGLFISAGTLFFLWGYLFAYGEVRLTILLNLIPLTIWAASYYIQTKMAHKNKTLTITLAFLPLVCITIAVLYFFIGF
ncbi:permease prefix domain 1-containing protein [Bacillus sp. 31A1R]|uniref:Permease prefix domain 1-containing protein n=1 Tax=Robertmurraya mangrovi TaxID=3098077 RepID=A0ABU5J2M8_9BACI|nr:permease prefix domain 1-containing protein [Bacillus sp. 31A1R]MDZ5473596.1 permease prefix domain 1-containing protein [Bacillus sp. 31A1R]